MIGAGCYRHPGCEPLRRVSGRHGHGRALRPHHAGHLRGQPRPEGPSEPEPGCLAVIPARGGSKRVPRKNIRPLAGKPLIAYTIAAALESGLFESVVVSTDSDEIAEIARGYGAAVPFMRDAAIADDSCPSRPPPWTRSRRLDPEGTLYASVCQLMPNCPLRNADDIVASYRQFVRERGRLSALGGPLRLAEPLVGHAARARLRADAALPRGAAQSAARTCPSCSAPPARSGGRRPRSCGARAPTTSPAGPAGRSPGCAGSTSTTRTTGSRRSSCCR